MISQQLIKHIGSIQDHRDHLDGWCHVSDLYDPCPREFGIRRRLKLRNHTPITVSDRLLYDAGDSYHNTIRSYLSKVNRLLGYWICRSCNKKHLDGNPLPVLCPPRCLQCKSNLFAYKEVTIRDKTRKIVGNVDAWIAESGKLVVTDVKSMGMVGYTNLRGVLAKHAFQVMVYRDIAKRAGFPVADYSIVLCVPLGYAHMQPFKEYRVDPDKQVIAAAYKRAEEIRDSATGRLPNRICKRPADARAKSCIACVPCFEQFKYGRKLSI